MVAALVAAAVLIPAGFHEAKALEPAASYVAGKHATVLCADTWGDWQQFSANETDATGLTVVGSSQSEFPPVVCDSLLAKLRRQPVNQFNLAASLVILTHESLHQRGMADEGQTECDAMHKTPRVAVKFFAVKPGRQLRALMAQAWISHREKPAAYQSVC